MPSSYSRHTSRFLSIYCFTLPFVLVQQLELATAPVVMAICWGLFSIEEIGHLIEEPFSPITHQLPLDVYARKIHLDVERLLKLDMPNYKIEQPYTRSVWRWSADLILVVSTEPAHPSPRETGRPTQLSRQAVCDS